MAKPFILVSKREYRRLWKFFSGEEPPEVFPQLNIKGIPIFKNERGILRELKKAGWIDEKKRN